MIRLVRLPDRFYLPRATWTGAEIRDVVPWDGAVSYVTDGARYGILTRDGEVRWFEPEPDDARAEGLREYVEQDQAIRHLWATARRDAR